jgi:hypothetical protein
MISGELGYDRFTAKNAIIGSVIDWPLKKVKKPCILRGLKETPMSDEPDDSTPDAAASVEAVIVTPTAPEPDQQGELLARIATLESRVADLERVIDDDRADDEGDSGSGDGDTGSDGADEATTPDESGDERPRTGPRWFRKLW